MVKVASTAGHNTELTLKECLEGTHFGNTSNADESLRKVTLQKPDVNIAPTSYSKCGQRVGATEAAREVSAVGNVSQPPTAVQELPPVEESFVERFSRQIFYAQSAIFGGIGLSVGTFFGMQYLKDIGSIALTNPTTALLAGLGTTGLAGAAWALDYMFTTMRGEVSIELDGKTRKTHFYSEPRNFKRTRREDSVLKPSGPGDKFPAIPRARTHAKLRPAIDKAHAEVVKRLSEQGRLLADLGAVSEYGLPLLHRIDALTAYDRLEQGLSVQVAVGTGQEDVPHTLKISGRNASRKYDFQEQLSWMERRYDYQLSELRCLADLDAKIPVGPGLPTGFLAVYRDQNSTSLAIVSNEHTKAGEVIMPLSAGDMAMVEYTEAGVHHTGDHKLSTDMSPGLPSVRVHKPGILGKVVATGAAYAFLMKSTVMPSLLAVHPAFGALAGLLLYGAKKVGDRFDWSD